MKKLYLHIGMHKTGTTALQYFFWNNRNNLKNHGIVYPKTGLGGGLSHGEFANIIKPNNRSPKLDELKESFQHEIMASGSNNILLSSEVFMEGLNIADATHQFLSPHTFDIKIIIYLRNQVDWLQSVYNEVVRDPYRRFTGNIFQLREYQQELYNYDKVIKPWASCFGNEAIDIRPYGNFGYKNELLHDFLKTIDIYDLKSFNYDVDIANQNIRLHPLATEFLRRINRFPMMQDEYFMLLDELNRISIILVDKYEKELTIIDNKLKNEFVVKSIKANNNIFKKYSSDENIDLFDNMKKKGGILVSDRFNAEVQHFIINNLTVGARQFLEKLIKPIKERIKDKDFINPPPINNEKRLDEIILRQRYELRNLYDILNKSKG